MLKDRKLEALVEKVNGKIIAIASDETKDRMGDVLKIED